MSNQDSSFLPLVFCDHVTRWTPSGETGWVSRDLEGFLIWLGKMFNCLSAQTDNWAITWQQLNALHVDEGKTTRTSTQWTSVWGRKGTDVTLNVLWLLVPVKPVRGFHKLLIYRDCCNITTISEGLQRVLPNRWNIQQAYIHSTATWHEPSGPDKVKKADKHWGWSISQIAFTVFHWVHVLWLFLSRLSSVFHHLVEWILSIDLC